MISSPETDQESTKNSVIEICHGSGSRKEVGGSAAELGSRWQHSRY